MDQDLCGRERPHVGRWFHGINHKPWCILQGQAIRSRTQSMNISQLAKITGVTTDSLRYYEKMGLLENPARQHNGYRSYEEADIRRVRFVRSAQTLGFSLAEIREIIPQLVSGKFGRTQIEEKLTAKIEQIDAHMKELRALKKELTTTFESLMCRKDAPLSMASATRPGAAASRAGTKTASGKMHRKLSASVG